MANGIRLSDGQMINADFIVLVSHLIHSEESSAFRIEFSNSTELLVNGNKSEVTRDHTAVRRAIGIPDPDLVR